MGENDPGKPVSVSWKRTIILNWSLWKTTHSTKILCSIRRPQWVQPILISLEEVQFSGGWQNEMKREMEWRHVSSRQWYYSWSLFYSCERLADMHNDLLLHHLYCLKCTIYFQLNILMFFWELLSIFSSKIRILHYLTGRQRRAGAFLLSLTFICI